MTLPIHCGKCGKGIDLRCDGWKEGGKLQSIGFACPWCGEPHHAEVPAAIVSAKKHDDNASTMAAIIASIS